jgi:exosortase D (VPLPA-CTERM-specific)
MADSVQVAPVVVRKQSKFFWGLPLWQGAALLLLIVWLYASILARLFMQWINDPNFQHGIFVPAFAAYVLWRNRNELKAIEPVPSWTGLPLIVAALVTLMLGVLGAELFLSRLSLLLLLAGLIILFRGWPLFRAVLFPWAILILMIPIPTIILQRFTFPLQMLASKVAATILSLTGVPVLREGNVIVLSVMPLEVAEACSGIRSLLSLVTLAIIYGYLMDHRKWVRVVLALSAVPIAVAANSFRIVGTGLLVQYWDPKKAEGFFHSFSGWLIFVVSLIMLFALHGLILRIWKSAPEAKPSVLLQASTARTSVGMKGWSLRFAAAAVFMGATALLLQARSRAEVVPPREPISSLPTQFGSWVGEDFSLDQQTRDILGAGEFLLRDYTNSSETQPPVGLFIAYFPTQKTGDTIHSPNHCLPGAGWVPTQREIVQLSRPDGASFPANRYVVSKAGDRELVIYWYQAHDRAIANEYWSKYYLVADSIRMNRSDGALVRMITPMYRKESADAAQARLWRLGSQLVPHLSRYIPR